MAPIEITPVATKRDRDAFIKFPWRIYRDDPAWVPPLIIERRQFLDREKHPFYDHGDAQLFLARRGGEIVGRIMASDDPNYNAVHGTNVGCFGLFDSIDDAEVASALFDRAESWLRAKGRNEIMGPIDYSTNYVCGLVIEGFEHPPTLLTPHNPPYYAGVIERCGFRKVIDWYAWWFADPATAVRRLGRIAKHRSADPITIRPVNLRDFASEARRLRDVYNAAWERNWGFVPFTASEFDHMARELRPIVVPETALFAEMDGRTVGFVLALPDINVILKELNGRLTKFGLPIGLLKLLYGRFRIKKGRLVALGVLPEFRHRGVAERLVLRVIEEGMLKRGVTGELSMTLENNHLVNRLIEAIGATIYKRYRIYNRPIAVAHAAPVS